MSGIIIPLYIYPTDPAWREVIRAQRAYPYNPIMAVVNPSSGPGTVFDTNYASAIASLKSAKVTVLGYITTTYGAKPLATVRMEQSTYYNWYGVGSYFYDEVGATDANRDYYYQLGQDATVSVGNPGVMVPPNYIGLMDNFVIYEGPNTNVLSESHAPYDPKNFSAIIHGLTTFPTNSIVSMNSDSVNYIYLTNGVESNPYGTLPWLWEMLAALFVRSRTP